MLCRFISLPTARQTWRTILNSLFRGPRPVQPLRRAGRTRPRLELLEDRLAPAGLTLVVSDAGDSATDPGSLRHAVAMANADTTAGDYVTIDFAQALAGATIDLGSTLELSNTTSHLTTIDGSQAPGVTIAGGGASSSFSVFTIDAGTNVNLTDLTITQGRAIQGGGIDNAGALNLDICLMFGNFATDGGAIYSSGTLNVGTCIISGNSAAAYGGGVDVAGGTTTFDYPDVTGNAAGRKW